MKNAQHYWSKHIAVIKSQGITTSAYARQHDLALATLYYWQRKLQTNITAGTIVEPMTAGVHEQLVATAYAELSLKRI